MFVNNMLQYFDRIKCKKMSKPDPQIEQNISEFSLAVQKLTQQIFLVFQQQYDHLLPI